uniref:Uncharacterized protein n=1 Tax=Arcella intermedia TaxID=1963864 RepID=A0A6B2L8C5_9EUKA
MASSMAELFSLILVSLDLRISKRASAEESASRGESCRRELRRERAEGLSLVSSSSRGGMSSLRGMAMPAALELPLLSFFSAPGSTPSGATAAFELPRRSFFSGTPSGSFPREPSRGRHSLEFDLESLFLDSDRRLAGLLFEISTRLDEEFSEGTCPKLFLAFLLFRLLLEAEGSSFSISDFPQSMLPTSSPREMEGGREGLEVKVASGLASEMAGRCGEAMVHSREGRELLVEDWFSERGD